MLCVYQITLKKDSIGVQDNVSIEEIHGRDKYINIMGIHAWTNSDNEQ